MITGIPVIQNVSVVQNWGTKKIIDKWLPQIYVNMIKCGKKGNLVTFCRNESGGIEVKDSKNKYTNSLDTETEAQSPPKKVN